MQKKMLIVPFFAACLLLGLCWGCKKNSSSPPASSSDVNLITQAAWKYDTSGIDLNQNGKIDNGDISDTASLRPCEKDDLFTFKKDSTGLIDEGATKCHVGDPQTDPLKWQFANGDKILNITSNTVLNGNLNILSLTASNLVLYKDTTYMTVSFRYLISLKH
jgi:hypothetical protein